MVYKEVNPDIWKYENDGDFIEGILIKIETDVGENKSLLYSLEIKPLKFISIWGSTILDQRMSLVPVGSKIKITYKGLGDKKPGKNPPKIFKVEVDDGKGEEKSKEPIVTVS